MSDYRDIYFSPAERRVLRQYRYTQTTREIADVLCVGVTTVKFHLTSIYKKVALVGGPGMRSKGPRLLLLLLRDELNIEGE